MPPTRSGSSGNRTARSQRSQNPHSQMKRPPSKGDAGNPSSGKGRKYASENERPDPSSIVHSDGRRRLSGPKHSKANPVIGTTGKRTTGLFPQDGRKIASNQQGTAPFSLSSTENAHPILAKKRAAEAPIKLPESSPDAEVRGNNNPSTATGERSYNPARGASVKAFPTHEYTAEIKTEKQPVETKTEKQPVKTNEKRQSKQPRRARMLNPPKISTPNPPKWTEIKVLNTR
ncbi:hypothetical protein BDN71DRAFT_1590506 [Pleurotus eryngii]|uniref:Uncharacterized protein n=1 Tax=Pleurotus eryngii TaxID=5323 RepID=A0A9P6DF89_PLEER|nr:hypothetical protein BDN71DRAFT_1590506 [Pleurotus eryngii]